MQRSVLDQGSAQFSVNRVTFCYPTVGQSVSNWGPWGKCSKSCDGEQMRTRTCTSSSDCEQRLEDRRECSSSSCFSK